MLGRLGRWVAWEVIWCVWKFASFWGSLFALWGVGGGTVFKEVFNCSACLSGRVLRWVVRCVWVGAG